MWKGITQHKPGVCQEKRTERNHLFQQESLHPYIGMDVFGTFEAALKQFDTRYEEALADHDYDPDCITYYARVPEADELRFTDMDGYEVFYRTEILQEAYAHGTQNGRQDPLWLEAVPSLHSIPFTTFD